MKIDLKKLIDLIETKNSWGKNELKAELLKLVSEED
jgi:hypothetical protein